MKRLIFLLTAVFFINACNNQNNDKKEDMENNPLLAEKFDTPFEVPPFSEIKNKHYLPAFKEAIKIHEKEIDSIVNNSEEPDFENTLVALDNSGELLDRVQNIFDNLKSANTNDSMNRIAEKVAPLLSRHQDDIALNKKLFQRIKTVYDKRDSLDLNPEQQMLLKKIYENFVRGGADLPEDKKERFREINKKLSELTLKFGDNLLKENNAFELIIDNKDDLAGLPDAVINAAAETATSKGYDGKWVFTLQKPSLIPFLTYSEKRPLREKIFKAYINRGDNNNENDNKEIIKQIVNLRLERAEMLGFKSHADYILDVNMAKNPENVFDLTYKIWKPGLKVAEQEAADIQKMIDKEGGNFKLKPWDWWYYSEKIRKEKYDLDEELLRPYFKLENVREGMFLLAGKLYGLTFTELKNVPVYQKDVLVFEVKDSDGKHIGIYYADYFPRESKKGGAWMTSFTKQSHRKGKDVKPVVMNVLNFTKPSGDKPALLSFEEVETMFHEFGHALHGLLSECTYNTLSGTSVARDFVELPSQITENWASEPEMLKLYARHYETNEPMPDELIEKIRKSRHFNQGFITTEYTAAALLDMYWHTLTEKQDNLDVNDFENNTAEKIGLIPEIVFRYRSTNFAHIFSGGYSAGYYAYQWAAVLDADAFQAFKETGDIFNKNIATKFRKYILSKGGTEDPMELYIKFRGKKPTPEALLKRKGFIK
ncbi:MAG: M3 family metallopeptidase [Chlorobi bacterium]|nr:M3 family metallopeptidase [Chlorobiota bacterium]